MAAYNCPIKKIRAGIYLRTISRLARQLIGVTCWFDGVGGRIGKRKAITGCPVSHRMVDTPRNAAMSARRAAILRSYGIHGA